MTPAQLSARVARAVATLQGAGALPAGPVPPGATDVALPGPRSAGDRVCAVALRLGLPGVTPATVAGLLAGELRGDPALASVAVEGGFLTLELTPAVRGEVVPRLVGPGPDAPAGSWSGHAGELTDVRYAHATACRVARNAADLGVATDLGGFEPGLLAADAEVGLLRLLATYEETVGAAVRWAEPARLGRHLRETSGALHTLLERTRVLPQGDEPSGAAHQARVLLVAATRVVLADGLARLGVDAPERM